MAEASWFKRIWSNLASQTDVSSPTYIPSKDTANDAVTAPPSITPPAGMSQLHTPGHKIRPLSVVWSPNGKLLASGAHGIGQLWNPTRNKPSRSLNDYMAGINTAAWSPNGKLLASGSILGITEVWDPSTGK